MTGHEFLDFPSEGIVIYLGTDESEVTVDVTTQE